MDTERQGPAFYRLWAQNEAYMKYTGLGFALPMSEFSVCQVNGRYQVVQNDAPIEDLAMLPVRIEGGYEGWVCTECKDGLKDKPMVGLPIIQGAKKAADKDVWEGGKILDPENGKFYTLRLTPIDGGQKLEVRGSIGPFGRTQTWVRVQ